MPARSVKGKKKIAEKDGPSFAKVHRETPTGEEAGKKLCFSRR